MALVPSIEPGEQMGTEPEVAPTVAGVHFNGQAEPTAAENKVDTKTTEEVDNPALAEVKESTAALPVVKLVPEAEKIEKPEVVKPVAAKVAAVQPEPKPEAKKAEPLENGIVVEGDDGTVRLVLRTDGPVAKHKSFWLKNPRRFVVDVPGRRNAFDRLAYELNHPLAERLRVGQHPDKVRFVVETSEDVLRKARLTPEDDTLIIDLKRR